MSRVAFRGREISGTRLRGLLALLAADLRAGCGTARLIDGLWPEERAEDRPDNPAKALQVLVSRARAQLGSDVIASVPTGYRLTLAAERVDAAAVQLAAAAATESLRAGDQVAALRHAEEGLALWDGPPAPDGSDVCDPVERLRAGRMPTYWTLARTRALAAARLGRHAEVVEALTELAGRNPRDEEVLLELLRAEAATAGPAAALDRYEAHRRTLADELGTDPGAALRAEHQRLLRAGQPTVRHGILYEPNQLLGRDADVAAVTGLLGTSRVTSIVGPGGLGKTRLAYFVGREAQQRVVHVAALAGVVADEDVVREVAAGLGVSEGRRSPVGKLTGGAPDATDLVAGIAAALGAEPALLVLDNCEHVLRGAAGLVSALVSSTRDLRVLTTSRAPLGLSSESVYPLPELDLATTVELFGQRARAARPTADLPAEAVADVCRHLDGLPLAVELAAARVRALSVPEIARRLEDRFAVLRGGARDAPERHQTLHAVVEWSWNLLDPAGQAAMRTLSIFVDGFTADAACQLLLGGGASAEPAQGVKDGLAMVEHLVDQSLLKVVDTPTGTRFRMLETVREFATERRRKAGEDDEITRRFLAWTCDFARTHHETPFGDQPFSKDWPVRAEQDNLVQALRLGLARDDGAAIAAATALLTGLWTLESAYSRLPELVDTVWPLSHFRPPPDLVEVTRTAATMNVMCMFMLRGPSSGRELFTLRRLPTAPPDTPVRAAAAVLREAPSLLAPDGAALAALCASPQPLLAVFANILATYVHEHGGDPAAALAAAASILSVVEREDLPWVRVLAHTRVAELALQIGQGELAEHHLVAALDVLEGQNWPDVFKIRWALVLATLQRGVVDEAEHWLEQTKLSRYEDLDDMVTFDLGVRAEIRLARGDVEGGLREWRRAVDVFHGGYDHSFRLESIGLNPWGVQVRAVAVAAHARHGRPDLIRGIVDELPGLLTLMLNYPVDSPPAYFVESPIHGTVLVALALVDLRRAAGADDVGAGGRKARLTRSAVRMIALAERFRFAREFAVTMSGVELRRIAEEADSSAYDEAVSSYAELEQHELRAAALRALSDREQAQSLPGTD
nr:BTAD domain-containing putative transcriptional regulator [Actinopolymorpha rutila]